MALKTSAVLGVSRVGESMRTGVRVAFLALVMASTIGCDRVTKHAATALLANRPTQSFFGASLRLTYAENTGGFLSLGAALPPAVRTTVFTVATGLFLVVFFVPLLRTRPSLWGPTAIALFLAGGISNLIDPALR